MSDLQRVTSKAIEMVGRRLILAATKLRALVDGPDSRPISHRTLPPTARFL